MYYKELIDYFDNIAVSFRNQRDGFKRAIEIFNLLNLKRVYWVLDVGCGNGFLFKILRRYAENIVGIDISKEMLKISKIKNNGSNVINSFAESLPFKSKSIDVVVNYCVVPHIKNRRQAFSEYYRVLKGRGRLFIIHPEGREQTNKIHMEIGAPVEDDLLPDKEILREELSAQNFQILNLIDTYRLFLIEAVKLK